MLRLCAGAPASNFTSNEDDIDEQPPLPPELDGEPSEWVLDRGAWADVPFQQRFRVSSVDFKRILDVADGRWPAGKHSYFGYLWMYFCYNQDDGEGANYSFFPPEGSHNRAERMVQFYGWLQLISEDGSITELIGTSVSASRFRKIDTVLKRLAEAQYLDSEQPLFGRFTEQEVQSWQVAKTRANNSIVPAWLLTFSGHDKTTGKSLDLADLAKISQVNPYSWMRAERPKTYRSINPLRCLGNKAWMMWLFFGAKRSVNLRHLVMKACMPTCFACCLRCCLPAGLPAYLPALPAACATVCLLCLLPALPFAWLPACCLPACLLHICLLCLLPALLFACFACCLRCCLPACLQPALLLPAVLLFCMSVWHFDVR